MSRIWEIIGLIRARFEVMTPAQQTWAVWHLLIDALLLFVLAGFIYVGFTADPNAFVILVPLFAFFVWIRFKHARERWSL